MVPVISEHIEVTQGICGGKPRIAGHRITVQNVVIWHERLGMSPDEIVSQYPGITLADVYAALAYYHDNLEEIRTAIRKDEDFIKQMQRQTNSKLQQKIGNQDVEDNSLSS
ncbi:DUF433 domain-containing protein [Calothrix sp. NIES-3974]|uniref:DUF433 domain-containing protein n=1 Tax=Calothrix sp. NIES-3974 TaxID=2005462 RepID=UPI000B601043|nr:DUF433 domain-containing protein [Calothrix sp. NIES-3974]BAZ04875.1 hypothetical protein NIES3974_15200 [Calothrix sp. NIES-3974]